MDRVGACIALIAAVLVAGCGGPPREFRMQEDIPVGPCVLSITGTDLSSASGQRLLTVYFRMRPGPGNPSLEQVFEAYTSAFELVDGSGSVYKGFAGPEPAFGTHPLNFLSSIQKDGMETVRRSLDLERWEAIIPVPSGASNFTLRIKNAHRAADQPSLAVVVIGR